jgi:hypothetical protein
VLLYVEDFRDLVALQNSCRSLFYFIQGFNLLWFQIYKKALFTLTNEPIEISDDEFLEYASEDEKDDVAEEEDCVEEYRFTSSSSSETEMDFDKYLRLLYFI